MLSPLRFIAASLLSYKVGAAGLRHLSGGPAGTRCGLCGDSTAGPGPANYLKMSGLEPEAGIPRTSGCCGTKPALNQSAHGERRNATEDVLSSIALLQAGVLGCCRPGSLWLYCRQLALRAFGNTRNVMLAGANVTSPECIATPFNSGRASSAPSFRSIPFIWTSLSVRL